MPVKHFQLPTFDRGAKDLIEVNGLKSRGRLSISASNTTMTPTAMTEPEKAAPAHQPGETLYLDDLYIGQRFTSGIHGAMGAVGASRRDLVAIILREAAMFVVPELAGGLVLAPAFSIVMRSFVYQLSPLDPISLASAAGLLVLLTMISAWIPARTAAALELSTALRSS